jgi:hypothetical protein
MRWDQRFGRVFLVSSAVSFVQLGVKPFWAIIAAYGVLLAWELAVFFFRAVLAGEDT